MNENKIIEPLPVYILIRTSNRPVFFKNMMDSIKNQTYPNIITIVHSDNDEDDYINDYDIDIILKNEKRNGPNMGSAPYNLFCNHLLKAIPDGPGWYHFMDDDDMYADNDSIERLVAASKEDVVNIGRSDRGVGPDGIRNIWPLNWKQQKSFQTECFFLHTKHKDKAKWHDKKAGDHYYSGQLTKVMSINWIDNLIVAKAQEMKGRGLRYDLGLAPRDKLKNITLPVYYLLKVKNPPKGRGEKGDIKMICSKTAGKLFKQNYVKIIDMEKYKCFISDI